MARASTIQNRNKNQKLTPSDAWSREPMQRTDREYNIIHEGILSKKDYTLLFEGNDDKYYIPAETAKRLDIFNDVTLSGGFLSYAAQKGIDVSVHDRFGNLLGTYSSCGGNGNVMTMLKQVELYQDAERRLEVARQIELAAFNNMLKNVYYYHRQQGLDALDSLRNELRGICSQIRKCTNMEYLMILEAQGRQKYYQLFDIAITNPDYRFGTRSKRPPENEVNAMISFGNTLLYNRTALEIGKTSLDIRIGVIHATSAKRLQTLNLDLAEIFKPLIVDTTVLKLVNSGIVDVHWDFRPCNGGIYLSESGKTKFIEAFNSAMLRQVTADGKKTTYTQLLRREVRNFRSYILNGTPYCPYR